MSICVTMINSNYSTALISILCVHNKIQSIDRNYTIIPQIRLILSKIINKLKIK
jgi:hypothetical protein